MKRAVVTVAGSLAVALSGAACASEGPGDGRTSVVTSIYPLAFVAERIGGEHVEVTTLTQPGQEPHDLELSVARTAEVADADLVVYGEGFQPAVDEAVETSGPAAVVAASELLSSGPDAIPGGKPAQLIEDDPHFWLDPEAMASVAEEVAAQLGEIDPEHADAYAESGAALVADLTDLDGRFATDLARCDRRTVVVSHDAFSYLGDRYDLDFESIAGLSPEAEPSPAHLAELQELVKDEGVTTVFSETLASPELAESLAGELGVATDVLDPVEGLSEETSGEDYLSLMESNLAALTKANGC